MTVFQKLVDAHPVEQAGLALMVIAVGLVVGLPYYVESRRGGILAGIAAVMLGVIGYVAFDIQFLAPHRALYGVTDEVRADCDRLLAGQNARDNDQKSRVSKNDPDFPASFRKIGAVSYHRSDLGMISICFGDGSFSTLCYLYDPHRVHLEIKERSVPVRAMWYRDFYVYIWPGE